MILYFTYHLTQGRLSGTGGTGWLSDKTFILDYEGDRIFGSAFDFQISDNSYLSGSPFVLAGDLLIVQNQVIFVSNSQGNFGYINYHPISNQEFLNIRDDCPQLLRECSETLIFDDPIADPVSVPESNAVFPLLLCLLFLLSFLRS
ncbi:hypothetical protein [Spirulina sp. 06S082]|uniref:hypothetical protein n=1 Tax=Spirulina sp. 06S082 TaxID=3110248 RepID=UPI002B201D4F|nr:hypothetical protein [Spirulina sp. 06S082]MEA5472155.1 hypothetical protein [Spirulina sp. 06S082]